MGKVAVDFDCRSPANLKTATHPHTIGQHIVRKGSGQDDNIPAGKT